MRHVLLLDMAIHTFDAARYISGADPVAVYCHEWNPAGSWYDQDASAVAIFEMSNGIVYTYRGSWSAEGLRTSWEAHWRAIGAQGSAVWHDDEQLKAQSITPAEGLIYPANEVGFPADAAEDKIGGHGGVIRDFVRCIQQGKIPETVATDNIKSLSMVFGAVKSAETGQRVEMAQLD
jgi:predicted dehydrogenase